MKDTIKMKDLDKLDKHFAEHLRKDPAFLRRQKFEKTLTDKQTEIQTFQMEKVGPQGEIYRIQDQLMAPIYGKIDDAIQKVGKEEGYDYIFNVVSGGIVYALPQYDVTDLVIQELEKISEINE